MRKLGFKEIGYDTVLYGMGDVSSIAGYKYYIGYKPVDYYGKNRGVVGIFILELKNDDIYDKMVIDDNVIKNNNYYKEIAESLYNKIDISKLDSLVDKYDLKYCYWISGKGIAGGIAAEFAHLIRHEKNDNSDIYCYTFGSPKTRIEAKNSYDNFIKNIINEDDYLTRVLTEQSAHRLGDEYNASIKTDFRYDYRKYAKVTNINEYTGDYMKLNSINNKIKTYKGNNNRPFLEHFIKDLSKYLNKKVGRGATVGDDFANSRQDTEIKEIITAYDDWTKNRELETASSVKAYWTLAKVLEGLDNRTTNGRKYEKTYETASSEVWDYKNAKFKVILEEMAKWYVENVYTYNIGSYGAKRENQVEANEARTRLSDGNVIRISNIPQYIENEQQYQDEYKYRFKYFYDRAGESARIKREQHLHQQGVSEEDYDNIMEFYDVSDAVAGAKYSVDILRDKEKVKYTGRPDGNSARDRGHYTCEKIKVIKNNRTTNAKVYDDCSAFVSTVIYKYLNDILEVNSNVDTNDDYQYDEWMTSSKFSTNNPNASILNTIGTWFECYEYKLDNLDDRLNLINVFPLQPGDILARDGHVEFYIDQDHSFGWGETHDSVENDRDSKAFRWHFGTEDQVSGISNENGYYFYNANKNTPGNREGRYTRVYRLKEEYR